MIEKEVEQIMKYHSKQIKCLLPSFQVYDINGEVWVDVNINANKENISRQVKHAYDILNDSFGSVDSTPPAFYDSCIWNKTLSTYSSLDSLLSCGDSHHNSWGCGEYYDTFSPCDTLTIVSSLYANNLTLISSAYSSMESLISLSKDDELTCDILHENSKKQDLADIEDEFVESICTLFASPPAIINNLHSEFQPLLLQQDATNKLPRRKCSKNVFRRFFCWCRNKIRKK